MLRMVLVSTSRDSRGRSTDYFRSSKKVPKSKVGSRTKAAGSRTQATAPALRSQCVKVSLPITCSSPRHDGNVGTNASLSLAQTANKCAWYCQTLYEPKLLARLVARHHEITGRLADFNNCGEDHCPKIPTGVAQLVAHGLLMTHHHS